LALINTIKNVSSRNTFVRKIMNEVKNDPENFGVDPSQIELVEQGMELRKINHPSTTRSEGEEFALSNVKEGTELLTTKLMNVLDRKISRLLKSKKELNATSISQLAKTFDIIHNISRLESNQSTENIALLAKVDYTTLSSEEKLERLLKQREMNEQQDVK